MNVSSLLLKFKNVLDKGYSLNLARYDGVRYGYRTKEFDDVYDMMIKSRTEAFGKEVKRSHIQTLIAMNEKSNNACSKELSEYIEQVSREDIWKELLKLDNKIIMAFLYSKYSTAKENHIHMEVEINNISLESYHETYQLVEIYGILIDNAMEATENYIGKKEIKIFLSRKEDRNYIKIVNPSEYISTKEINNFFNKGFSTKANNKRGIGLYKLKQLLNSNKGTITFFYDTLSKSVVVEVIHI